MWVALRSTNVTDLHGMLCMHVVLLQSRHKPILTVPKHNHKRSLFSLQSDDSVFWCVWKMIIKRMWFIERSDLHDKHTINPLVVSSKCSNDGKLNQKVYSWFRVRWYQMSDYSSVPRTHYQQTEQERKSPASATSLVEIEGEIYQIDTTSTTCDNPRIGKETATNIIAAVQRKTICRPYCNIQDWKKILILESRDSKHWFSMIVINSWSFSDVLHTLQMHMFGKL